MGAVTSTSPSTGTDAPATADVAPAGRRLAPRHPRGTSARFTGTLEAGRCSTLREAA